MGKAPSATKAWERERQQHTTLWVVLAGTDQFTIEDQMGKFQTFLGQKEMPPISYLHHPFAPLPPDLCKITKALSKPEPCILISGVCLPPNTPNNNFLSPRQQRKAPRKPDSVIWLAGPEEPKTTYNKMENLCLKDKIPFHTAPKNPFGRITPEGMFSEAIALFNDASSHKLLVPLFRYANRQPPHVQNPATPITTTRTSKEEPAPIYALS